MELGNDLIQQTDQVAGADHTDVVGKDDIGCADLTGKINQIALPVAVVDLIDLAVVVHEVGHHSIAEGFLYHNTHRAVGHICVGELCVGLVTGGEDQANAKEQVMLIFKLVKGGNMFRIAG